MSAARDRENLIEAAASAWRPRTPGRGLRAHPAWSDLDEEGRKKAFQLASALRTLEAALDPEGLSTTGRAVLDRIRGARDVPV